jgi:hypothetical protein
MNEPILSRFLTQPSFGALYVIPMAVVGLGVVYAVYVREPQAKKKTE